MIHLISLNRIHLSQFEHVLSHRGRLQVTCSILAGKIPVDVFVRGQTNESFCQLATIRQTLFYTIAEGQCSNSLINFWQGLWSAHFTAVRQNRRRPYLFTLFWLSSNSHLIRNGERTGLLYPTEIRFVMSYTVWKAFQMVGGSFDITKEKRQGRQKTKSRREITFYAHICANFYCQSRRRFIGRVLPPELIRHSNPNY